MNRGLDQAADQAPQTQATRPLSVNDTHQARVPIRWGDCDSFNHLNNAMYLRVMEEARAQILYGAGLKLPGNASISLAHASCDFLRPLTYPSEVNVTHRVVRVGRSSLEFELILDKVGDGTGPYAQGRNVLVWVDSVNNRSAPWPIDVLDRMGGLFTPAG